MDPPSPLGRDQALYRDCSGTAGPPVTPGHRAQPVAFRHVASPAARLVLTVLVLLNVATIALFTGWLLLPGHVPGALGVGVGGWQLVVARLGYCLLIAVELIRLARSVTVWTFAVNAKDPVPMDPPAGLQVALVTTIVPAKEPIEAAERTLRAMKEVRYAGTVDVWILDEGDDPAVRAMAARLGVRHFSRKNSPEYNQLTGEFRVRTRSGNHNAWRAEHEREYDVVAVVDPGHVPVPGLLERTLGYFRDPDVAFVVTPRVYANTDATWVARAASVQQYPLNGFVARGGNGLDAAPLTGAGHLYRPSAWRQIGGYRDSVLDGHATSVRVHTAVNPETGHGWRSVYTPDVVVLGEGPTTWADYFNQQRRRAYGIWQVLLRPGLRQSEKLPVRRRWQYRLLRFYHPSVAAGLALSTVAGAVYLLAGASAVRLDVARWLVLWGATLASWVVLLLWLRRYHVAAHERRRLGLSGLGLTLFAGPVHVAAGTAALLRRRPAFVVTARSKPGATDSLRTFRLHLVWAVIAAAALGVSFTGHHALTLLRVWAALTLLISAAPPVIGAVSSLRGRRPEREAERAAGPVEDRREHDQPHDQMAEWAPPVRGKIQPTFQMPSPRRVADSVPGAAETDIDTEAHINAQPDHDVREDTDTVQIEDTGTVQILDAGAAADPYWTLDSAPEPGTDLVTATPAEEPRRPW